jgi:hypothetical protein
MMGFVKLVLISYRTWVKGRGPNPHLICQYHIVTNYAITIQEISLFFLFFFL